MKMVKSILSSFPDQPAEKVSELLFRFLKVKNWWNGSKKKHEMKKIEGRRNKLFQGKDITGISFNFVTSFQKIKKRKPYWKNYQRTKDLVLFKASLWKKRKHKKKKCLEVLERIKMVIQ